eukprot:1134608-Pelagomonas_calceolata.AAC.1
MQMRYGSIGWSVGATLGYAAACAPSVYDIKACDISQISRIEGMHQDKKEPRKEGVQDIAPSGGPDADGP